MHRKITIVIVENGELKNHSLNNEYDDDIYFSGVTPTLVLTDFTTWLSELLTDIATSGELIQVRPEK